MHPYSINSSERERVTCFIALVSTVAALLVNRFFVSHGTVLPWWLDAPSVTLIFGLLYSLFDRSVWRWRVLHRTGLICTPNLGGTWLGSVTSSVDGGVECHEATLVVEQHWTRISVSMKTAKSKSSSVVAAMIGETASRTTLCYEYRNEPVPCAEKEMHAHRGSAQLTIGRDSRVLEGEYYTGRDRQTHGSMRFELQ
jgi:hypothetical protein